MLAAVLWLGNVTFLIVDNENHVEPVIDEGIISGFLIVLLHMNIHNL